MLEYGNDKEDWFLLGFSLALKFSTMLSFIACMEGGGPLPLLTLGRPPLSSKVS